MVGITKLGQKTSDAKRTVSKSFSRYVPNEVVYSEIKQTFQFCYFIF